MTENLTDVDVLLLERWTDTVAIWDAINDLENRLADRLEAVAERLRPWLEQHGYLLVDVDKKYAAVNVGKSKWMTTKGEPLIYISVSALYPFGYRRVDEEHPYVWVQSDGLSKEDQQAFQAELARRLGGRPGDWINEHCSREAPAGRYVESHGDAERVRLAQSLQDMEDFIKTEIAPMLALGVEVEAALETIK